MIADSSGNTPDNQPSVTINKEGNAGAFQGPRPRLGAPEYVDYHMILDQELTQLSKPETGIIGSVGFTATGAGIGFYPSFAALFDKFDQLSKAEFTKSEIHISVAFAFSVALAVTCLLIFFIGVYRNIGLAKIIRNRKRQNIVNDSAFN